MPRSGSEPPRARPVSLDLREQALLARRLSLNVVDPVLRDRLVAYADELEAEVASKEQTTAAMGQKAAPLRMRTLPIRRERAAPTSPLPAATPVAIFSPVTVRLLQAARSAAESAATLRGWRMSVRPPFEIRTAALRA